MIDYEKLKIVHTMAENLFVNFTMDLTSINGAIGMCCGVLKYDYKLSEDGPCGYIKEIPFANLDFLLKELEKLTQHESRYKVGDEVWYIDCTNKEGPICQATIGNIQSHDLVFGEIKDYGDLSSGLLVPLDCLFPSRAALIECQLKYWSKLYEETYPGYLCLIRKAPKNECKHLWVRGKCHDCGIEKTDIRPCMCGSCDLCFGLQRNQSQVDVDRCQHDWQINADGFSYCCECNNRKPTKIARPPYATCQYTDFKCQHESDGMCYTSHPPQNKCIKCGEFYR